MGVSWTACEQALLFGQAKRAAQEHMKSWTKKGWAKESLQWSVIINFPTKGNTIGWKMVFQKSKLIDQIFGANLETQVYTMPLSLKPSC